MKKLTISILTLILFSSSSGDYTSVYICTGKYSKKYHYTKNCRGLSNCKGKIVSVSLDDAKINGKTICGWED